VVKPPPVTVMLPGEVWVSKLAGIHTARSTWFSLKYVVGMAAPIEVHYGSRR